MENGQMPDPYEAVIADLRAQQAKIEQTISLLESLRGKANGATFVASTAPQDDTRASGSSLGPGEFLGMSIVDAAKKLLAIQRKPMRTPEIVVELERGGLVLQSADKVNTVGSILLRRFYQTEDIVRLRRGVWGLAEWYPGKRFPKGNKAEDTAKGEDSGNEEQQPSDSIGTQEEHAGPAPASENPFARLVE